MFSRFPNHIDGFSKAFLPTFGTRGDDTITLTGPGIAATGRGNDVIVTSSGPNLILTGPGSNTVQNDGGFARVFGQDDITVVSTGGITRVTLSEGAVGTTVIEAESHEGMTPPDIIIWDIAGDGESGDSTVWPTTWKIDGFDSPGTSTTASLQEALDDVVLTQRTDSDDAHAGYVLQLGDDAIIVVNDPNSATSLDELIRTGEIQLQIEVAAGITVVGSEARDIVTLDETVEDVFVFQTGIEDPVAYQPVLEDVVISGFDVSGSGNAPPTEDALGLTNVTQEELDRALASQVRTEDGAVVTIDDLTITFFAGEAILVTEDFFVL